MSTQIHDLGYRAYSGERAGVWWAVRSLALHSIRRALGLKRAGKHKIVPFLTITMAFLPAVALVGFAAFIGDFGVDNLISYGQYYSVVFYALSPFVAASAPGVLTTDRTNGMLALYLASPLTRTTYVIAKALALFLVMLLVTVGPILFLVIAYTLVGSGPGGVLDVIEQLVRALLAGVITAAAFTGIGMFISSIPRRWGIASVCIIASLLVPVAVAAILTEQGGAGDWFALAAPALVIGESWERVLGDAVSNDLAIDRLDSALVVAVAVGYAALALGLTWWRYQTIEVER